MTGENAVLADPAHAAATARRAVIDAELVPARSSSDPPGPLFPWLEEWLGARRGEDWRAAEHGEDDGERAAQPERRVVTDASGAGWLPALRVHPPGAAGGGGVEWQHRGGEEEQWRGRGVGVALSLQPDDLLQELRAVDTGTGAAVDDPQRVQLPPRCAEELRQSLTAGAAVFRAVLSVRRPPRAADAAAAEPSASPAPSSAPSQSSPLPGTPLGYAAEPAVLLTYRGIRLRPSSAGGEAAPPIEGRWNSTGVAMVPLAAAAAAAAGADEGAAVRVFVDHGGEVDVALVTRRDAARFICCWRAFRAAAGGGGDRRWAGLLPPEVSRAWRRGRCRADGGDAAAAESLRDAVHGRGADAAEVLNTARAAQQHQKQQQRQHAGSGPPGSGEGDAAACDIMLAAVMLAE